MEHYQDPGAKVGRSSGRANQEPMITCDRENISSQLEARMSNIMGDTSDLEQLADRLSARLFGRNLTASNQVLEKIPGSDKPAALFDQVDRNLSETRRRVGRVNELLMAMLQEIGG